MILKLELRMRYWHKLCWQYPHPPQKFSFTTTGGSIEYSLTPASCLPSPMSVLLCRQDCKGLHQPAGPLRASFPSTGAHTRVHTHSLSLSDYDSRLHWVGRGRGYILWLFLHFEAFFTVREKPWVHSPNYAWHIVTIHTTVHTHTKEKGSD